MNYSDFVVDKMIFKKIIPDSTVGIYVKKILSEDIAVNYEQKELGNFISLVSGTLHLSIEASGTTKTGTLYVEVYSNNNLIGQNSGEINSGYVKLVGLDINVVAGRKYIVKAYTSTGTSTTISTNIHGYIIDNADEYIIANT